MKKLLSVLALVAGGFSMHLSYVFYPIDDVDVSELALRHRTLAEHYGYHKHLKLVLSERNSDSLKYLIAADCGGAAGCYEHGTSMVQVLIRLGDAPFSEMMTRLSNEESAMLLSLLSAGHEYGDFSAFPRWEDFTARFPLTFNALRGN